MRCGLGGGTDGSHVLISFQMQRIAEVLRYALGEEPEIEVALA